MRSDWVVAIGAVSAVLGLGFWACSAERAQSRASHGIATPLDAKDASRASAGVDALDRRLRIDELTSFLAQPRFATAREAYLDGRFDDALSQFEGELGDALDAGKLDGETWFQLGHLRVRAGSVAEASQAFEHAAETRWVLSAYCRYFAARARFASGNAEAALSSLTDIPRGTPFTAEADLLHAEILLAQGSRDRAIQILRTLLSSEPRPQSWPRASLVLAEALAGPKSADDGDGLVEALDAARRVSLELAGTSLAADAAELEATILGRLPPKLFERHQPLTPEQELSRLTALVDGRRFDDALAAFRQLASKIPKNERFSATDCEARLLEAKILAADRKWGKAVDGLGDAVEYCKGEDFRARLLFVAGKFAQYDKRYSAATRLFEKLEREAPTHRLADDARIRRADSYLSLGDEARFTELSSTIVEDYPDGDVALDGIFDLAMRRIEKGAWAQAANVLERTIAKASVEDRRRDHEFAGRERYFRARAWGESGEPERALSEYEALIAERPLSYYMLHAFSRLFDAAPERAVTAFETAMEKTEKQPFAFAHRPEFETEGFQRALALARHGELDWAARELSNFEGLDQPEILWAVARVYGRAGEAFRSHQLARGRLTDWLQRWPAGDWRKAWKLAFPRPYHDIVKRVSEKQEVPQALIYAVMREESAFRADVVSHADAFGLMQLIKPTAKHFGNKLGLPYDEAALKRPSVNIALGASVLSNYKTYFPSDPLLAIPGYNAGPGRPRRWKKERGGLDFDVWVELIPFNETRRYTKRVLASRGAYTFLYEASEAKTLLLPLRFAEE